MTGETGRWFAGLDLRSEKHLPCVLDEAGAVVGERASRHDATGLAALCDWFMSNSVGAVPVATEVPRRPVVDTLLDSGLAMYAINPKQLDRLHNRFSLAGAKDDGRDAQVAAAGLRTTLLLFRRVTVRDPGIVEHRSACSRTGHA
jgi:hypothetical protein